MPRIRINPYSAKNRALQRSISKQAFEMGTKEVCIYKYLGSLDSENPSIFDVGNKVFDEVPDRVYDETPYSSIGYMRPSMESMMDYSEFGILNPENEFMKFHIDHLKCMGRLLITGDILYIPFLDEMKEGHIPWWEVSDVDETQVQEKFYINVTVVPLSRSRKNNSFDLPVDDFNMDTEIFQDKMDTLQSEVPYEETHYDDEPAPAEEDQTPVDPRKTSKHKKSFLDDEDFSF